MRKLYHFAAFVVLWRTSLGLFENCDYQDSVHSSRTLNIGSPNYPNRYNPGSSCRYTVTSPVGTRIDLQCDLAIDNSQQQCTTEFFYVNPQGSTSTTGSEYFCGTGQLHKISFSNRLVVSYVSSGQSTAGRFLCTVKVASTSGGSGSSCECGWSVTRKVVGGMEATINEYPSVGGMYDKSELRIFCGATIINIKYLLSAAHCLYDRGYRGNLAVIVGDHDFTITYDSPYTKTYDIIRFIVHEQFDPDSKQNDIALMETTTPMEYSNGIGPACLPFKFTTSTFAGSKVEVAGWGTLSFGGNQPHKLQKASLDVIPNSECIRRIPALQTSQLCTYTFGKDTCQYDSGGGVFFRQNRMYVVGITSYGFGCAMNFPSVSTRVSPYLNWIQARTNVEYCRL